MAEGGSALRENRESGMEMRVADVQTAGATRGESSSAQKQVDRDVAMHSLAIYHPESSAAGRGRARFRIRLTPIWCLLR